MFKNSCVLIALILSAPLVLAEPDCRVHDDAGVQIYLSGLMTLARSTDGYPVAVFVNADTPGKLPINEHVMPHFVRIYFKRSQFDKANSWLPEDPKHANPCLDELSEVRRDSWIYVEVDKDSTSMIALDNGIRCKKLEGCLREVRDCTHRLQKEPCSKKLFSCSAPPNIDPNEQEHDLRWLAPLKEILMGVGDLPPHLEVSVAPSLLNGYSPLVVARMPLTAGRLLTASLFRDPVTGAYLQAAFAPSSWQSATAKALRLEAVAKAEADGNSLRIAWASVDASGSKGSYYVGLKDSGRKPIIVVIENATGNCHGSEDFRAHYNLLRLVKVLPGISQRIRVHGLPTPTTRDAGATRAARARRQPEAEPEPSGYPLVMTNQQCSPASGGGP